MPSVPLGRIIAFKLSAWARQLCDPYPDPNQWSVLGAIGKDDIRRFVSLWLTEGIPFAFRDKPMIYEHAREYIAQGIGERSRQVTVIGSARLGFSLAPPPKFGKAFEPADSDLDALILSSVWFEKLQKEFLHWKELYLERQIAPTDREARYWEENLDTVPRTLRRGFIDTNKIPNRPEFPSAMHINDMRFNVVERINREAGQPLCKKISFRVYKNWDSALAQITMNVEAALKGAATAQRTGS